MEKPLVDLILLSWNHPEVTRPCVESILANTEVPSRLIIIDQGSNETTREYLKAISSSAQVDVEILWNPENVGFPRGMNQGLRHGNAPYVCFLNNDILVPPGWLGVLLAVAQSDASIGLVNPASNTFGIRPALGMDWLALAKKRRGMNGRWTEVRYAEGFCILAQREMVEQVGGFDETTFKQIYFEDADLSRRIQALGLRCVMAEGTYVWHHEGKTMGKNPERLELFQENERRFTARWGKGQRVLYALGGNPRNTNELYEQARAEANRCGDVRVMTAAPQAWKEFPKHLSIRVASVPAAALTWVALWKTLTKKKKFAVIRTDIPLLAKTLEVVGFAHQGKVEVLNSLGR